MGQESARIVTATACTMMKVILSAASHDPSKTTTSAEAVLRMNL